jgi:hypothetical protein
MAGPAHLGGEISSGVWRAAELPPTTASIQIAPLPPQSSYTVSLRRLVRCFQLFQRHRRRILYSRRSSVVNPLMRR